jgi:hypothetical protein
MAPSATALVADEPIDERERILDDGGEGVNRLALNGC